MGLILDTNFVIAAEREKRLRISGTASIFLAAHTDETLAITFTVAGELAAGRSMAERTNWQRLCAPYTILPWSQEVAWQYGKIFRQLQSVGRLIGANDLWIAATALVHGMSIVTNNAREFQRIEGLTVISY